MLACVVAALLASGCTNMKRSDTARTGKEQLLISNAVDQSLNKVSFEPFRGHTVYLDDKYLDSVDKGYIMGSLRHRIAHSGGTLVAKPDEADIVLEARSGGVGTDNAGSYLGIPEIVLPGMLTLPEVKFIERSNQTAIAKIGLAAYDAHSMRLLGDGGTSLSKSTDNNWFVMGAGPYQDGTVKKEVARSTESWSPATAGQSALPYHVAFDAPPPSGASVRLTNDSKEAAPEPTRK